MDVTVGGEVVHASGDLVDDGDVLYGGEGGNRALLGGLEELFQIALNRFYRYKACVKSCHKAIQYTQEGRKKMEKRKIAMFKSTQKWAKEIKG